MRRQIGQLYAPVAFYPKEMPWYLFLLQAEWTPGLVNADRTLPKPREPPSCKKMPRLTGPPLALWECSKFNISLRTRNTTHNTKVLTSETGSIAVGTNVPKHSVLRVTKFFDNDALDTSPKHSWTFSTVYCARTHTHTHNVSKAKLLSSSGKIHHIHQSFSKYFPWRNA